MLMGIFLEDFFLDLLKKGLEVKKGLEQFCVSLLNVMHDLEQAEKFSDVFHAVWASPALAPLTDVLRIYTLLPRCVCHLLCTTLPDHIPETTDSDVYAIANYNGSNQLERSIKRVLRDPQSFWMSEINDLLKKGADTALSKIQVQELGEILEKEALTFQQLQTATSLLNEIRNSVRSQRLGVFLEKFTAALVASSF